MKAAPLVGMPLLLLCICCILVLAFDYAASSDAAFPNVAFTVLVT